MKDDATILPDWQQRDLLRWAWKFFPFRETTPLLFISGLADHRPSIRQMSTTEHWLIRPNLGLSKPRGATHRRQTPFPEDECARLHCENFRRCCYAFVAWLQVILSFSSKIVFSITDLRSLTTRKYPYLIISRGSWLCCNICKINIDSKLTIIKS